MSVTVVFRARSVSLRLRNETRHEASYRLALAADLLGVDEIDTRGDDLRDSGPKDRVLLRYEGGLQVSLRGRALYLLRAANRVFVEVRVAGAGERTLEIELLPTGSEPRQGSPDAQ
jgi:hypothetical protein